MLSDGLQAASNSVCPSTCSVLGTALWRLGDFGFGSRGDHSAGDDETGGGGGGGGGEARERRVEGETKESKLSNGTACPPVCLVAVY